jgi:hypothetical protein
MSWLAFFQVAAALTIAPADWKFVSEKSGPVNYYSVVTENGVSFLRSKYTSGLKTAVMGWKTPEADRRKVKRVQWTWRAQTLPKNGDECASDRADSAAVVYLTFKRGLRYYTLKYVWSSVGKVGAVCDSKRNPFVAQDTIILESGGPPASPATWKSADVDLAAEYRKHFEGGDPNAEVPDFIGIGLMSDGDQTKSDSSADFGTFTLVR